MKKVFAIFATLELGWLAYTMAWFWTPSNPPYDAEFFWLVSAVIASICFIAFILEMWRNR